MADTAVEYGTTAALGQTSLGLTTLAMSHGLTLSGLTGGTTYYFRGRSTNASGVVGYSTVYSFTTLDNALPTLSNIQVLLGASNTATVSWAVSKPATSEVEYGPDTSYGMWTVASLLTQSPQLTLNWLTRGTVHYRLHSMDASGNQTVSQDYTFIQP